MRNRLLFLLILCLLGFCSPAQINVSLDNLCMSKNAAILVRAMLDFAGRDTVSQMLESKTRVLFYWKVDSLGYVYEYADGLRYREHNTEYLPKDFLDRFMAYLIRKKICFYICYGNDPGTRLAVVESHVRDEIKKEGFILINVAFPGEFRIYYDLARKKAEKEGWSLSRLEYMEEQIQKLLGD